MIVSNKTTSRTQKISTLNKATPTRKRRGRPKLDLRGGHRKGAMRYPLQSAVKKHLANRELRVKPITLANERRILLHMVVVLENLKVKNPDFITNPWKMGRKEIRRFLDELNESEHPLEGETIEKQIRYLDCLLKSCGNRVIDEMKSDSPRLFPKRKSKPIRHLSERQLEIIQKAANQVEGWNGAIMRLMSTFYPGTGVRPSELRLAGLEDLDTHNWTFRVRHPKGEGSYGDRRMVFIMPFARRAVLAFLKERQEHLNSLGLKSAKYLIPRIGRGKESIYSANHFRNLKDQLKKATGITFQIKDFRSTFASLTVKKNPTLMLDVSKQLGHSSIEVTQRYYADIEAADTGRRLCEAWGDEKPGKSKNTSTERMEYITGYV
jgi:integrase